ncbi:hypothetical protein D3C86_1555160 [compost metagenome]
MVVTGWPLTVTVMGPLPAPAGTRTLRLVALASVIVPATPLNSTRLFVRVLPSKPVPVRVTSVPGSPCLGAKSLIVGRTEKLGPRTLKLPTCREVGPEVAPEGTLVVRLVVLAPVGTAASPLNLRMLPAAIGLKPVPVTVTLAATCA